MNPYFIGDKYWTHPIQCGRSTLFFKYPLKTASGKSKAEIEIDAVFAYFTKVPSTNPNEVPQKKQDIAIKQKVKNWWTVGAKPIIQYIIEESIRGRKEKGSYSLK